MERFLADWSRLVSESDSTPKNGAPQEVEVGSSASSLSREQEEISPEVAPFVHAALRLVRKHLMGIVGDALGDAPIPLVAKEEEGPISPAIVAMEVVRHAVSLVDLFVAQFPGLPRERLVLSFLGTVRGCLGTGYKRSWEALYSLGLTDTKEVCDAVEKTRDLIRKMLTLYEHHKRIELARDWPQLARRHKRAARR